MDATIHILSYSSIYYPSKIGGVFKSGLPLEIETAGEVVDVVVLRQRGYCHRFSTIRSPSRLGFKSS